VPLWPLVVVQWLHVAFAIAWVGGTLAMAVLVAPAAAGLPLESRRAVGRRLAARAGAFYAVAGTGTLLLGIVRGTLLGSLRSVPSLATPYGLTWLVALVITVGLAMMGALVVGPAFDRMHADDRLWAPLADGEAAPALTRAARRLDLLSRAELAGFGLVLGCMVLMSVGM
jgi:putative copper resistance protein D